jgi:hypothetical protein
LLCTDELAGATVTDIAAGVGGVDVGLEFELDPPPQLLMNPIAKMTDANKDRATGCAWTRIKAVSLI